MWYFIYVHQIYKQERSILFSFKVVFSLETSATSEIVHEEGHLSRKRELEAGEKKAGSR